MEIAKLIVDLIGKIIWPIVLLVVVVKFRKQIVSRFKDINEIEFPGGFKAKLSQVIQATVEEVTDKLDPIFENQIDSSPSNRTTILTSKTQCRIKLYYTSRNKSLRDNLKYTNLFTIRQREIIMCLLKYIGLYSERNELRQWVK